MFNKTIRSALSLALVFCLLLGMSGNAIALAAGNPVDSTLDKVDSEVYGTIDQLNAMIDQLEDVIDELEFVTLPEAVATLADAEQKLLDAEKELAKLLADTAKGDPEDGDVTAANKKLEEAQQKLADAKDMLEGEKLAELRQTAYEKAFEQFSQAVADAEKDAWQQFEDAVGQEYKTQSDKLQQALKDAEADLKQMIADEKAKLNQTLADKKLEMEAEIADKQAELDQRLADAKAELDEKLALAGADQAAIDAAYAEFDAEAEDAQKEFDTKAADARRTYADAKAEAERKAAEAEVEAWDTYDAECEKAWVNFNEEASEAVAEEREKVQKAIDDAKVQAKQDFELKFEEEFSEKLAEMEEQLVLAEDAMVKVEAYVAEVNAAVEYYLGVMEDAKQIMEDAKALIKDAEEAIKVARETIDQARTLVDNLENSYTELRNAVTSPEPSVSYIKETIKQTEDNYNAVWEALLELDEDVDNLIAVYDELSEFEVGEIEIHRDPIIGFEVGPFQVTADTDGDGVEETYGMDKTKLETIDLSQYDFHFEGMEMPELPATVEQLDTSMDQIIAKGVTLNAAMFYFCATAERVVAKALNVAEETLGFTYNFLRANLSRDMHIDVYNWLYNNPDKVCALVEKFGVFGLDLIVRFGPFALDLLNNHFDLVMIGMKVTAGGIVVTATLGAKVLGYLGNHIDFLKDYKTKVMNAARKLYAKYGDEAKALLQVYVDYLDLEERYFDATHAVIELESNELNYVAIGGYAASEYGYTDKLAELLGEELNVTFNKLAGDVYVNDVLQMLDTDEVKAADLITVGFGNLNAINNMIACLMDENGYTPDWSLIANDTIHELVTKALAELEAELVAYGLDAATTAKVLAAAEAYAHTFALDQLSTIKLINKIQALNPDAQIVIVSAYNELDTVNFIGGSRVINAGNFIQPLVDIVNLQGLAEGFLNDNVIYVHATDVELETTNEVVDITSHTSLAGLMVLLTSPDGLIPTEESSQYMAQEIRDALTILYKTPENPDDPDDPDVPDVPECEHLNVDYRVELEKEPTCTEPGSELWIYYCVDCLADQRTERHTINPKGHVEGIPVIEIEVNADCENAYYCEVACYCEVCGEELWREYVHGDYEHQYVEYVNFVMPTCTENGYYSILIQCEICGDTIYDLTWEFEALGHDYDDGVVTEPTCTEGGYTTYTCQRENCGHTYNDNFVPALGHEYELYWDIEPTCTEDGYVTFRCWRCGDSYTIVLPALGHTAGDAVIENEVAADCVNPGSYDEVVYCTVCGEELSRTNVVVPALGHNPGEAVYENEVLAGCETPGSFDLVVYCEVCGEELSRDTYYLDPTGHIMGKWQLYKMPTFSEEGELRRYCLCCDYYESHMIPALWKPDFDFDFDFGFDFDFDCDFEIPYDATHADYTIFHDSLYLSIGDGSAVDYSNKLAQLLEIPHMLQNLAQNGMTVEDAIELVGQNAELVGDADLITLGFSNITASIDMMEALAGMYEPDWSGAIGETGAAALEKAIAELEARLVAEGMEEDTISMIVDAATAYAYTYASRCLLYPNLVKAIRDVNPEALIVLVGTYNDMENVMVTLNGHEFNIGEYTKYLIKAANLENLLQAIVCEDVIYVDAPDVETVYEEMEHGETNVLGYLMSLYGDEMLPSEAGSAYIAQQIRNALNVRYEIWGDVNGDRRVDCRDARLVLRYAAQLIGEDGLALEWADVNGDGVVNARDARLILRLRAQLIEHFPVCRFSEE